MDAKEHIVRLPTIEYPDFDLKSTELAISIPLFYSEKDTTFEDFDAKRFQDVHCKGAIWAALSLFYNTDLGEKGVGIYFHIEDKAWEFAKPVFDAFSVDEQWIRLVSVPGGEPLPYKMVKTHFGKKFIGLLDDELDPDVLLVHDSDAFILAEEGPLAFYEKLTSSLLKSRPTMTYAKYLELGYRWWVDVLLLTSGRPAGMEGELNKLEQAAYKRLGFDRELEMPYGPKDKVWRVWCENYMITFPRDHPVRQYTLDNLHTCYCSPYIHSVWSEYHEPFVQLQDILGIPVYSWLSSFIKAKTYDCIMHCRMDMGQKTSRIDAYYDDFWEHLSMNVPSTSTGINDNENSQPSLAKTSSAKPGTVKRLLAESASDKDSEHCYGFMYDLLFAKLTLQKQAPLKLLEIGTSRWEDGSLSAWDKSAQIERAVGIDVHPYRGELSEKTTFHQLDAYRHETIRYLAEQEGSDFDIIIDDAIHQGEQQAFILDNYMQLLSENGILVCEDVFDIGLINEQCKRDDVFFFDGWGNIRTPVKVLGDERTWYHNERLLIKSKSEKISERRAFEASDSWLSSARWQGPTYHCVGIPHLPSLKKYLSNPHARRVLDMCKSLVSSRQRVIYYGHPDARVHCHEHVPVQSREVFEALYGRNSDPASEKYAYDDAVYEEFSMLCLKALRERMKPGDFVILFWGVGHHLIYQQIKDTGVHIVNPYFET